MPLIVKALQNLGGESDRSTIKKELANVEPMLVDAVSETKPSKSGEFCPLDFRLAFALKTLAYAGYLTYARSKPVTLTDKGINADADKLNPEKDIYPISNPKWQMAKQKKLSKRSNSKSDSSDRNTESEVLIDDEQDKFKNELLKAIAIMSPKKFEILSRMLLKKMGVTIDVQKGVSYTSDGGIDGYGYLLADDYRTSRIAIQSKRWSGKVSSPEIDRFRGAMDKFRADYGIFITNNYFTNEAINSARNGSSMITLVDGDKLTELIIKYNVHISPVTTYTLDDFYLVTKDA